MLQIFYWFPVFLWLSRIRKWIARFVYSLDSSKCCLLPRSAQKRCYHEAESWIFVDSWPFGALCSMCVLLQPRNDKFEYWFFAYHCLRSRQQNWIFWFHSCIAQGEKHILVINSNYLFLHTFTLNWVRKSAYEGFSGQFNFYVRVTFLLVLLKF